LNRYATSPFLLLSTHAHVLIAIAEDPDVRQRELAERVGVTERTVQSVITDLVDNDYLSRTRVGRRNVYAINTRKTLAHPALHQGMVASMLTGVVAWNADDPQEGALLDAARADAGLQELAVLAGRLLHSPFSFIVRREAGAERIVAGDGVPAWLREREIPLEASVCEALEAHAAPLVFADVREHSQALRDCPIAELGFEGFAALPAVAADGQVAGAVCVGDPDPRRWSQAEIHILTSIAVATAAQIAADDLSRRYQAEANRYRALLDSLPETVVLVFDRDLRMQVASGEALERSGFRPDRIVGRTLDEVTTPEKVAAVRPHYVRGLNGERHRFTHAGADGISFVIDIVPLVADDGNVDGVMAIARQQSAAAQRAA